MRKIKILNVKASVDESPSFIEVANDYTQVFQGKFYRNPLTGEVLPFYTSPAPVGYTAIKATSFDIVDNTKYAGRYTVYTPAGVSDEASSVFASGNTRIYVNEIVSGLAGGEATSLLSDGSITNISTYLLYTGTGTIVIPPAVNITTYPIEFMGRDSTGWGEAFTQNFLNLARNFANPTAPSNPFVGQTWFDTDDNQMRVWNGSVWDLVNKASFGVTFRFTQGSPATVWTINHGLGLQAPYIAFCQLFVDRGDGPQIIIPSNVEFLTANQMRVTFSNPEIGYALVRQ